MNAILGIPVNVLVGAGVVVIAAVIHRVLLGAMWLIDEFQSRA